MSEEELVFCDEVFRTPNGVPRPTSSDTLATVYKRLSRIFLITEYYDGAGEVRLDFCAPIMCNLYLVLRFGSVSRAIYSPVDLPTFLINTFHCMDPAALGNPIGFGKNGQPLERVWQMEFYRAASRVLPKDYKIVPDVGAYFGARGLVDFYVKGEKSWAIELLRDGDGLKEHAERFKKRYKKIVDESDDWVLIDIRRNGYPSPEVLPAKQAVFIECSENFEFVSVKLPDRAHSIRMKLGPKVSFF